MTTSSLFWLSWFLPALAFLVWTLLSMKRSAQHYHDLQAAQSSEFASTLGSANSNNEPNVYSSPSSASIPAQEMPRVSALALGTWYAVPALFFSLLTIVYFL